MASNKEDFKKDSRRDNLIFFTAEQKSLTRMLAIHFDNHVIFLTECSSNTNSKWPAIVEFLNTSGLVWT